MYDPQFYTDNRRRPSKPKVRHLFYLLFALVFATAIFGWLDAKAQWVGFSQSDGFGGRDYYAYPDPNAQMLNLGVQGLWMGHQAQMQRRQLNAQHGWVEPKPSRRQFNPRQVQSPNGKLSAYPEW